MDTLGPLLDGDGLLRIVNHFIAAHKRLEIQLGGDLRSAGELVLSLRQMMIDEDKKRMQHLHAMRRGLAASNSESPPYKHAQASRASQRAEEISTGNVDLKQLIFYLTLANLAYGYCEQTLREELGQLGCTLLKSRLTSRNYAPGYVLLYSKRTSILILVIRGSQELSDFITNLTCDTVPFCGARGHKGVIEAAQNLWSELAELLATWIDANKPAHFTLAGHSIGGAVSSALTLLLREGRQGTYRRELLSRATCYAYCPPPFLSDSTLASRCTSITTVVHGLDLVPRLSVASFNRLLMRMSTRELISDSDMEATKSATDVIVDGIRTVGLSIASAFTPNVLTHLSEGSTGNFQLSGIQEKPPEVYLVGRILHLWQPRFQSLKLKHSQGLPFTHIVERQSLDFMDVEASAWMVHDHGGLNLLEYLKSIQSSDCTYA